MARIVNDCVQEETLSFQIGDECYFPPFSGPTQDRTDEILAALKKCCKKNTRTIIKTVKETEVKYVEIQTTKYVYLKPGTPIPVPQDPLIIPRGSIKPLEGWTIYNEDWYYKYSNYRWYFKSTGRYASNTSLVIGYEQWKSFSDPSSWEALDRSFGIDQDPPVVNPYVSMEGYNKKTSNTIKIKGNEAIVNGVTHKGRTEPFKQKVKKKSFQERIKELEKQKYLESQQAKLTYALSLTELNGKKINRN